MDAAKCGQAQGGERRALGGGGATGRRYMRGSALGAAGAGISPFQ